MTTRDTTSLRLQIRHTTHYSFEQPVRYGLQKLRKTARSTSLQNVLDWTTALEGASPALAYSDHHGNRVELIAIDADTRAMSVTCTGEVEVQDTAGVVGRHRGPAPLWLYLAETDLTQAKAGVKGYGNICLVGLSEDEPKTRFCFHSVAASSQNHSIPPS